VYTERWNRLPPLPDVGGRIKEIEATEERLGRTLPPSLREWVAFAYDVHSIPSYNGVLRFGYHLGWLRRGSVLSLLGQDDDSDVHWQINDCDLNQADPQVFFEEGLATHATPKTVTQLALSCCLSMGRSYSANVSDAEPLLFDLVTAFKVRFKFANVRIFESENLTVRLYGRPTGHLLQVDVYKTLARDQIPRCLWDYMQISATTDTVWPR
jgi:hypothetical protein